MARNLVPSQEWKVVFSVLVTLVLVLCSILVFYLAHRQNRMAVIVVERHGKTGIDAITTYPSLTDDEKKSLTSAKSFALGHLRVDPDTARNLFIGIKDGESDTLKIVFFNPDWFDWEPGDFIPTAYGGFPYYFEISTSRATGLVVDSYAAPE